VLNDYFECCTDNLVSNVLTPPVLDMPDAGIGAVYMAAKDINLRSLG